MVLSLQKTFVVSKSRELQEIGDHDRLQIAPCIHIPTIWPTTRRDGASKRPQWAFRELTLQQVAPRSRMRRSAIGPFGTNETDMPFRAT